MIFTLSSGDCSEASTLTKRIAAAERLRGWRCVFSKPAVLAFEIGAAPGGASVITSEEDGVAILGCLFEGWKHKAKLNSREFGSIIESGGEFLIGNYWGSYVAILRDRVSPSYHFIRDPMGGLPCYHASWDNIHLFFSHIDDVLQFLPYPPEINSHYLSRWLIFGGIFSKKTGFADIDEVPPGTRTTIKQPRNVEIELWSPSRLAATSPIENVDIATEELRSVVQGTVDTWCSRYDTVVHKLSGGLDSSIVAGCICTSRNRPDPTFVNIHSDSEIPDLNICEPNSAELKRHLGGRSGGPGDERYYARLVAERWNAPLIEIARSLDVDVNRIRDAPLLPAPSSYIGAIDIDDAEIDIVSRTGSKAIFCGEGGDAVFFATSQNIGAIDYAYTHGLANGLYHQILMSSKLSKESVWSVTTNVMKHGLLRRPYRSKATVLDQLSLLNDEILSEVSPEDFSIFREDSIGLPPGKRNHIDGVACAYYNFSFNSHHVADHVIPLQAQPVWELMLRIPSYIASLGGISRGLARFAFKDLLPNEIRSRQTKGTGSPFYQRLARRNLSFIRDFLLDGQLMQRKLLSRQKLENCLASEEPFLLIEGATLLNYVAAESWLQQLSVKRLPSKSHFEHKACAT